MRQTLALLLIATCLPVWAAQPVRARHGMVVSRERHATAAGSAGAEERAATRSTRRQRVGLALAVTHPSAGNIGGGGFMLIRLADGRTTFIDFRERRSAGGVAQTCTWTRRARPRRIRLPAIAPPACRARCAAWSTRSRSTARSRGRNWCIRAVELAAKGFPVSYALAQSLRAHAGLSRLRGIKPHLSEGRQRSTKPASCWCSPNLARTLERIEKLGSKGFYEGETGAPAGQRHGGTRRPDHRSGYEEVRRA